MELLSFDYKIIVLKLPYLNQLIAGFVIYGITAWCSEGYHHPDEHFQILELANYRLGGTPAADLPWEFGERMRPGLQPGLAYTVICGLKMIGIASPFLQAFGLRLISGWLMWLLIYAWARQLGHSFAYEKGAALLLWLSLLLWFMPYLSVRFSSELWAGLSFLTGLFLITQFIDKEGDRMRGWLRPRGHSRTSKRGRGSSSSTTL